MWTTTKVDGIPALVGAVYTWEVKGHVLTTTRKGPDGEFSRDSVELKLHESDKPRWLELKNGRAPDGQPSPDGQAIYELVGDTLTVCSGGVGDPLPKEFKAGEKNQYRVLMVFRRGNGKDRVEASSNKVATGNSSKPAETLAELKGDLARLQGEWTSEADAANGTIVTIEIKGKLITMTQSGPGKSLHRSRAASFRIDETATPKTLNFLDPNAPPGRDTLGIYELDGETLKIAIGDPGTARPTEFRAGEGNKNPHLLILKRK